MKKIKTTGQTTEIKLPDGSTVIEKYFQQVCRILLDMPVEDRKDYRLIDKILTYLEKHQQDDVLEFDDAWVDFLELRLDQAVKNKLFLSSISLARNFVMPLENADD
jgi:ribosomal protein S4